MDYRADDRLELALRASNEGIWDWDVLEGSIHYSGRILWFLGYRRNEMPHIFKDLIRVHEDDREEFEEKLKAVMVPNGESLLAVEPRMQTAKGEWRYFRIRGTVVRTEDGEVCRMAGSMIDISRRKLAEEQLMEERHLMRLLVDSVPLNIYFKDLKSRFSMVSRSQANWLGCDDPAELVGKTDHDYFNKEHADRALMDEQKILETGEPIYGYVERETLPNGDAAWVLTTKMPLVGRNGDVIGTFGVSSNVSELVQTQQSLAETAAALQQRNNEIEEELNLAREVQMALLPQIYPVVPVGAAESRVKFGHRYIPISGLAGDFFEVFPLGGNAVGMFMCDVMGHGVRSAIVVSMLRGLLEQAGSSGEDPGRYLAVLNTGLTAILQKADVTMFATGFAAVVDLEAGELRYASAGHPAGIIRTDEGASLLPMGGRGPGPGLGLFKEAEFETQSMKLDGIRELLLFTDGIYEVENRSGEAFLENRLVKVVGESTGEGVEALLESVLNRVLTFADSQQFDDDVCLLAMELS